MGKSVQYHLPKLILLLVVRGAGPRTAPAIIDTYQWSRYHLKDQSSTVPLGALCAARHFNFDLRN